MIIDSTLSIIGLECGGFFPPCGCLFISNVWNISFFFFFLTADQLTHEDVNIFCWFDTLVSIRFIVDLGSVEHIQSGTVLLIVCSFVLFCSRCVILWFFLCDDKREKNEEAIQTFTRTETTNTIKPERVGFFFLPSNLYNIINIIMYVKRVATSLIMICCDNKNSMLNIPNHSTVLDLQCANMILMYFEQ